MPVDDIKATPIYRLPGLYVLAGTGALVNVFRSLNANPTEGTLFINPYWIHSFLNNYQDGYRRRALVGTLCRILFPAGVPILFINLFAFAVLLAVFALFVRALCRLSLPAPSNRTPVFLFALCASILTAVFYETLGDLLQITLVLFSAANLLAARCLRKERLQLLAGLAVIALGFFIHEASIFLLAPALPFFLKQRPRLRDFVPPLCLAAVLLAISMHWSVRFPHPSYFTILGPHRIMPAYIYSAPPLQGEFVSEYRLYFATPSARLYFATRLPRIAVLAFSYLTALALCLPRRNLQRTLFAFVSMLLLSLPLWCIAIDWGRFLTCTLFLSVVSSGLWTAAPPSGELPPLILRLAARIEAVTHNELLQLGALYLLITGPETWGTHVEGPRIQDAWSLCIIAAIAFLAGRFKGTRASKA